MSETSKSSAKDTVKKNGAVLVLVGVVGVSALSQLGGGSEEARRPPRSTSTPATVEVDPLADHVLCPVGSVECGTVEQIANLPVIDIPPQGGVWCPVDNDPNSCIEILVGQGGQP